MFSAVAYARQPTGMSDCHENASAEGTLACGSVSYRLWLSVQGGSLAAALQGASRIFMPSSEPKDHGLRAQDDRFPAS